MNVGSWKFVMALNIVSLLLSVGAAAQLREERPNYGTSGAFPTHRATKRNASHIPVPEGQGFYEAA